MGAGGANITHSRWAESQSHGMGGVLFRGRGIEGVRSCCHGPCPWWRGFHRQAGLPVHWPYSTKKRRMNGSVEKIECFFAEAQKSPDNRRACRQGGDGGIGVKIRLESMQSGLGVVPIVVLVGRLHDIISVPFALSLPLGILTVIVQFGASSAKYHWDACP